MMIIRLASSLFLLSSIALVQSTRVIGRFGKEIIPIDFQFGDDVMIITSHKPVNGHDTFRETSNLHVFSRRSVAIRNTHDKECYIQPFNATLEGMKEKVKYARRNKGLVGEVKEERVMVDGSQPIGSKTVKSIFGPQIAKFCDFHDVYVTSDTNSRLIDPKDISLKRRAKRLVAPNWGKVSGDFLLPRFPRPSLPWWRRKDRKGWKDIMIVC